MNKINLPIILKNNFNINNKNKTVKGKINLINFKNKKLNPHYTGIYNEDIDILHIEWICNEPYNGSLSDIEQEIQRWANYWTEKTIKKRNKLPYNLKIEVELYDKEGQIEHNFYFTINKEINNLN